MNAISALSGGLVVSCQAPTESPLAGPEWAARVAQAVLMGGAAGLRVNGAADVAAVRRCTTRPIVGLHKVAGARRKVITPSLDLARGLADAGADIIAIDASVEALGDSTQLLSDVRALGLPVMADVSTLDEGLRAWDVGSEIVATTLSGYTPESAAQDDGPDIELVARLADRGIRVVAEGRYRTPGQIRAAFNAGAFAVVVGGAITDPIGITERFAAVTPVAQARVGR